MFRLLSLFLLFNIFLHANVFVLDSYMDGITPIKSAGFFEDKTKKLGIEDIKNQKFKTNRSFALNRGASKSNWWIKYEVQNPTQNPIDWVLKFNFGQFDEMQCWQYDSSNRLISHFLKGDHHIDETKTSLKERTSFEFYTPSKTTETIYIKLGYTNSGIMELFHSIWSKNEFIKSQEVRFNLLVGITSALLVLLFYNIFIWLFLRKNEYFWYNTYLLGVIFSVLTFNQLGAHFLWSDSLYLIDMMPFVSVVILFASFVLFTRAFLETKKFLPKIDKLLKILVVLNIAAIIIANFGERSLAIGLIHLSAFSFVFFPLIAFVLWRRGYTIARGYVIASSILAITILGSLLRYSEILQTNELLFWSVRFGFIAEGILLSIALADRITILENAKIAAQENEKHILEKAKHTLESEVRKRTQELLVQTQKAQKLARTDEMTGIYNRRAFLEHGEKIIYDAVRYESYFSLIIIDIDHFKEVNDSYGHEAGDIVLKSFTHEISSHIRDSDFFARIGGEEFVLILPHTLSDEALQKANIILESIRNLKIPYQDSLLNVTASMGICQFKDRDETIYTMLAKADKALYYVKENGRNSAHICSKC